MLRARRRPFHVPLGRPKEVAWAECAAPADGIRLKKRSSVRHNPLSRSTTFQAGEFNLAGQIVGGAVMVCKPPQIQDKKPQLKWRPHFQSICQQKCWNLCASEFVFVMFQCLYMKKAPFMKVDIYISRGTFCSQDPWCVYRFKTFVGPKWALVARFQTTICKGNRKRPLLYEQSLQ